MNADGLELKAKARYRQNSDVFNQQPTTFLQEIKALHIYTTLDFTLPFQLLVSIR